MQASSSSSSSLARTVLAAARPLPRPRELPCKRLFVVFDHCLKDKNLQATVDQKDLFSFRLCKIYTQRELATPKQQQQAAAAASSLLCLASARALSFARARASSPRLCLEGRRSAQQELNTPFLCPAEKQRQIRSKPTSLSIARARSCHAAEARHAAYARHALPLPALPPKAVRRCLPSMARWRAGTLTRPAAVICKLPPFASEGGSALPRPSMARCWRTAARPLRPRRARTARWRLLAAHGPPLRSTSSSTRSSTSSRHYGEQTPHKQFVAACGAHSDMMANLNQQSRTVAACGATVTASALGLFVGWRTNTTKTICRGLPALRLLSLPLSPSLSLSLSLPLSFSLLLSLSLCFSPSLSASLYLSLSLSHSLTHSLFHSLSRSAPNDGPARRTPSGGREPSTSQLPAQKR
jgi:hypothetical protein